MTDKPSASERVQASYRELSAVATNLNTASDELGKIVTELEGALQSLNLGIAAWVTITNGTTDEDGDYWSRDIGYAKVNRDWGIALRTVTGNERFDTESREQWSFNSAPRWLRIEGIGKIPELLDQLIKQASETTERLKKKTTEAKELTTAIKSAHNTSKAEAIKATRQSSTTNDPLAVMPNISSIASAAAEASRITGGGLAATIEHIIKSTKASK